MTAHFTGRAEYLGELHEVVRSRRRARGAGEPLVVFVHGPGGVGKSALVTRFAHEIAGRYPDGRLYVDLRGAGDVRMRAEDVLIGFLAALGHVREKFAKRVMTKIRMIVKTCCHDHGSGRGGRLAAPAPPRGGRP